MRLLLLALVAVSAGAQVETRIYPQPLRVGSLWVYAIDVCNGSDQVVTVPGAVVWQQASVLGVTLALPMTIVQEQLNAAPARNKRLALYVLSTASGIGIALAGSDVFHVNPDSAKGKLYYGALSGITVFGPIVATQIEKAPSDEVQVDTTKLVPGLIQLGPHACQSYVHPGTPTK